MRELTLPREVTLRRQNVLPYVVGPMFAVALMLSLPVLPLTPPLIFSAVAMAFGVLVLCYLDGPAAFVRVTRSHLVVANVFSVHWVPRRSVKRVGGYENLGVDLFLHDGRKISVTAFEPSLNPWGRTRRDYVRLGRRLEQALESTAAEGPDGAPYRRRLRCSSIVLSAGALGLLAAGYFWAAPLAGSG